MFFDIAGASSLLSALALFVSTCPGNLNNNNNHVHVPTKPTDLHSCRTPSAFLPRTRIPTRTTRTTTTTTTTTFHPSFTALNNNDNDNAFEGGAYRNSNNLMVSRAVKPEKYAALLEWLASNGATLHESLDIRPSSQGEQAGYGVFVDRPVQQGELLFSIPRTLCVTIEKATSSVDDDGAFGDGLQTLIDTAGPGGSTVAMAGYMAKEYILMVLDEKDRELAENSSSSSSSNTNTNTDTNTNTNRWGPYMELLPWKRGINNQEHILFWNEAKIEELLRGSLCYTEARNLRREVSLSIQVLGPLLKRSVLMARGELSTNPLERLVSMLPWQRYQQNSNPNKPDLSEVLDDRLIGDAIKGAFVTLLTRSFADDEDEDVGNAGVNTSGEKVGDDDVDVDVDEAEKLVPLLDLLQHSDTPNVRHSVVGSSDSDAMVEVRARIDIDPGSELWNQYRSEEDEAMPYSRFFTRFGFVPGIGEPIVNLLLDKSPIFYPKKVEV